MKERTSKIVLNLLLFILSPFYLSGEEAGLFFLSHEVIKDKRTSLELSPDRAFNFSKGFVMEFDLLMRDEVSSFGYIFRIIANDSVNVDFLSGHRSGRNCFWLVGGSEQRVLFELKDIPNFRKEQWFPVVLEYAPENKAFTLSVNGKKEMISLEMLPDQMEKFRFCFGANNHKKFFSTDVPPMNVKNISLKPLPANKVNYFWPLSLHDKDVTKDVLKGVKAVAINPVWLIDDHVRWKKAAHIPFALKPLIAYNEKKGLLYFVQQESILTYNIATGKMADTLAVKSGHPYETEANQIIYNPYVNQLWSYDFNYPEIVVFDFETKEWSASPSISKQPRYWHHNHLISPVDSALVTFGGYGHFRYHSLIQEYKQQEGKWTETDLSSDITPRYLSAAGRIKNNWLVFGGYGSKTGEQQVSPHSTFDLYRISLDNYEVEKLWEMPVEDTRVQSNSMIIDSENNCFYTLSYSSRFYNSYIQLYAYQIDQPGYKVYADSIPYLFNDTQSYCDLYFSKKANKFVALTLSRSENSDRYEVNMYTLASPPVSPESTVIQKSVFDRLVFFVLPGILLLIIGGCVILFVKFKKRKQALVTDQQPDMTDREPDEIALHHFQQMDIRKPEFRPSSLLLLGGFQVINNKGKDITGLFSPTLKNILLLILLNTLKNNKGISSVFLQETFWFDKSEKSARNNRNVNLKKLRDILEEIEGVDIDNSTGYWNLHMDKNFYCDYIDFRNQAGQIKEKGDKISSPEIVRFINLVSAGPFLPGVQAEWGDGFKSEYTNLVIDCVSVIIQKGWETSDYKLLMQCANILLLQDPTDENAMHVKCYALNKIGKKGLAKVAYELFCRDYSNLLNEEYTISFEQILACSEEDIKQL